MPPHTRVVLNLPGGGGFGHPFERSPERVLHDVINGYVSMEAAKEDYGVIITESARAGELVLMPEDYQIDGPATRRYRDAAYPKCLEQGDQP